MSGTIGGRLICAISEKLNDLKQGRYFVVFYRTYISTLKPIMVLNGSRLPRLQGGGFGLFAASTCDKVYLSQLKNGAVYHLSV